MWIPYGKQTLSEEDIQEVVAVLKGDFITQGPKVKEFEEALCSYCGARYAVVFSSGTSALHGAYHAAGIRENDAVITSPMTFAATANAALYLGANVIFVDVDERTGNILPSSIEEKITRSTRALVPIDYAGHPVELEAIQEIARKYGLLVIEDACHSLGASYRGKKIGSLSDMTIFSFHPVKSITTGEGGAVLTDRTDLYENLLQFRTHGITKEPRKFAVPSHGNWYHEMQMLGYNYRLTDIQCALGTSQMRRLDAFIQRRREIAAMYRKAFEGNPYFDVPQEKEDVVSAWHLYPIRFKDGYKEKKARIVEKLHERGIGVQVHYLPVYLHPYYRQLGYEEGLCPKAEDFYRRELGIPIFPSLKDEEIERVVQTLLNVCEEEKP